MFSALPRRDLTAHWALWIVARDMADYEKVLMQGILNHDAIANSSSKFVLRRIKHQTALPV